MKFVFSSGKYLEIWLIIVACSEYFPGQVVFFSKESQHVNFNSVNNVRGSNIFINRVGRVCQTIMLTCIYFLHILNER